MSKAPSAPYNCKEANRPGSCSSHRGACKPNFSRKAFLTTMPTPALAAVPHDHQEEVPGKSV
jgi:hypothetical protein